MPARRTAASASFPWRSVAISALLPTFLFSLGEGATLVAVPIVATGLGATLAVAGLVAAMFMLGELLGDIPSGVIVARVGERAAMIGAAVVAALGFGVALLATHVVALGVGALLFGLANATFSLARHAFMTSYVPVRYRGRALSTLGGVNRAGLFVGPFLSALVIGLSGEPAFAFLIGVGTCLLLILALVILRDPETVASRAGAARAEVPEIVAAEAGVEQGRSGVFRTIWARRAVMLRLGGAASLVAAIRASRDVILPLWGLNIGMDAAAIALVMGLSATIDFVLFYTGGQIMDRFGRLWSAVPAVGAISAGMVALALTHGSSGAHAWFVGVAVAMALGNGLTAGLIATMGSDVAGAKDPAPFLGAWRFTTGVGEAAAPFAISGITALWSLAVAAGLVGGVGVITIVLLLRYVPRFIPHLGSRRQAPDAP